MDILKAPAAKDLGLAGAGATAAGTVMMAPKRSLGTITRATAPSACGARCGFSRSSWSSTRRR